jgi:hypothetical protein
MGEVPKIGPSPYTHPFCEKNIAFTDGDKIFCNVIISIIRTLHQPYPNLNSALLIMGDTIAAR